MTSIRSLLGRMALAGALAACGGAALADRYSAPVAKASYEVAPARYNWSSLYLGASMGHQWTDVRGTYTPGSTAFGLFHDTSPDSLLYGGHIGFQHQMGSLVLGIEAAVSGTGLYDNWGVTAGNTAACLNGVVNRQCESSLGMVLTLGPRIGWVIDQRWMIYATGGYASASVRTRTLDTATGAATSEGGHRHDGWFIGGGAEWILSPIWVLGVEYQHLEVDTQRHLRSTPHERDVDAETDIIRGRLSLKIGPSATVGTSAK